MVLALCGSGTAPAINAAFGHRFSHDRREKQEKSPAGSRLRGAPKLAVQPGASVMPMPVGRCGRYADGLPGLFDRQTREVTQFDELCGSGVVEGQLCEGVLDRKELVRRGSGGQVDGVDVEFLE